MRGLRSGDHRDTVRSTDMNSVRGREVDDRGSNLWKGQHQNGNVPTLLRDVASVRIDETYGEYHRRNMQRMVTVTANVHQTDLGAAAVVVAVAEKLGELPDPPRGVTVSVRGQLAPLSQIFENFRLGVVLSMIAVFLLLVAYFQSVRVALAVITTLPGVLTGVFAALWVTGSTLNLQSFMGAMIAVGISVANAILLCTFAERYREEGMTSLDAALESGRSRLRPIVMTTLAFVEQMTAYLRVTAPFDGVVTERRVHVGALVGPDTSYLVRLEQVGRLRLVTPVPESYAAGVVRGAEVSFSVAAHVGESFTAVISRPSLSVSFDTRTMAVEADVDNRDGRLAPGMYAEVSWTLRRDKESLFVPRSAVARTTERVFVIRVRNGEAEWIDVRRGVFQRDRVEVFGNLTAGDRVVLHATDEIRPGTAVTSP